jgi:nucleoside-diphosphate-sugar epimerase
VTTYLVTGAGGCIGAWTVQRLLARGHAVVTFDLPGSSDHRLRMVLDADQLAAVQRVHGDVAAPGVLAAALDAHGVTRVIHLAALQVPFVRADPQLGARVNVEGTVNVFEAARAAGLTAPLVYASSIAALDAHGAYKRANENAAAVYNSEHGLPSIGLRPHTVYGPGRDQGLTSEPSHAMLAAAAGRSYRITFAGSCQLHHASDAAEAFVRASELPYEGASVHNLDGPVASTAQIVAAIEQALPDAAGLVTVTGEPLPFPAEVDAQSFLALVGGPTARPLHEGVRDAVEHYARLIDGGQISAG